MKVKLRTAVFIAWAVAVPTAAAICMIDAVIIGIGIAAVCGLLSWLLGAPEPRQVALVGMTITAVITWIIGMVIKLRRVSERLQREILRRVEES